MRPKCKSRHIISRIDEIIDSSRLDGLVMYKEGDDSIGTNRSINLTIHGTRSHPIPEKGLQ